MDKEYFDREKLQDYDLVFRFHVDNIYSLRSQNIRKLLLLEEKGFCKLRKLNG